MHIKVATVVFLSYGVASAWESWAHRYILHASLDRKGLWGKWGVLGTLLKRVRFNHHVIHHNIPDEDSHAAKLALALLSANSRNRLNATQWGKTIQTSPEALLLFCGVPVASNCLIFTSLAPDKICVGLLIGLLPYLVTKYLHPVFHASK